MTADEQDQGTGQPGERPNEDRHAEEARRAQKRHLENQQDAEDEDLDGLGQAGTSGPTPGIDEDQGGGIPGAIGGGQSGQGGG